MDGQTLRGEPKQVRASATTEVGRALLVAAVAAAVAAVTAEKEAREFSVTVDKGTAFEAATTRARLNTVSRSHGLPDTRSHGHTVTHGGESGERRWRNLVRILWKPVRGLGIMSPLFCKGLPSFERASGAFA
ncbi:MAG: hypothetical protein KatS3mg111_3127 [Pirellulaceae bacterium]|nr:MAG: hypothetical protein KatS3mg111_3127 [Pirellulaceae bacterium]